MAKPRSRFCLPCAAALLLGGLWACASRVEGPAVARIPSLPRGTCSVEGTVRDAERGPVAGALLTVDVHRSYVADTDWKGECPGEKLLSVRTDGRARYSVREIPTLPPGQYLHLRAEAPTGGAACDRLIVPAPLQSFTLDLELGATDAPLVIVGTPAIVDRSFCGSGAIMTADPRTGVMQAGPH